jgi:hypothetical protein
MMEAVHTSETSVDNHFTRQYIPEDSSEHHESIDICESKSHKSWFDEKCLKLVDQRKQVKLQWLQDPSEVTEDNLSNVR